MNTLQAIAVAILQGATELFPVSSLGHAVVVPRLLGWQLDQHAPSFLPFLVMLHLGTAIALLAYFWTDWWRLAMGVLGRYEAHHNAEARRIFALIVLATIPAVVVGFVLEKPLRALFGTPSVAAAFLVVNGAMLLFGEKLRGRVTESSGHRQLSSLTPRDALLIGCAQCGALIPGISRSGATIVAGLLRGIDHAGAAHFSFLIATPIIFGATVLEVPKLLHAGVAPGVFAVSALAAVVAGVTAWLSTWFLMRYFRQHDADGHGSEGHDSWALNPFGYYCIVVGLAALGYLFIV